KTATLTAAGEASFGAITYTEADAGKTYTYTITENGFGDGWTGTGDVTATVVVEDNGNGTLKTTVTYNNDDTITNTYKAEGEAEIEVIKELEGSDWPEGETLTLTLTGEGGTLPETRTVELTAAGTATFDPISYTEADAGKTYTYTITEDGFGPGWTGSGSVTATVEVTDNGDGTLSTDITYSPEDATIINTYKPLPTWIDPPVKKIVNGDPPPTAETFNFTMTAGSDDTPMPDGKKGGTKSMSIKGAGEKEFGVIEYTEPGTYTYTITELAGSNKNYTYDSTSYTITVEVTDEGGQLVATVTGGENEAGLVTFTNTYRKPPTPPKPPVVPKTGDDTPQTGMLFLLGAALLGYGVYRRRKA
ncbi:MAG: hypothetical protein IJH42_03960, partial [Atopobiaceae bacterium]|nr:hypothetical protein [Atopobiaceae bacterium]